jgi:N-acetylmuramoyl-L-alanine amidase
MLAAAFSLSGLAPGSSVKAATVPRSEITIALDAGHQTKQDLSMERIDPDKKSLGKKYKMAGGCTSVYNHMPEYKYTLIIAKKLKADLEKRGYKVYMVRSTNNVHIGCQARAKKINKSGAKICIRLHCDSYGSSAHGVSTIYKPGHNSYYSKSDAARSKVLASYILSGECKTTGFTKRYNDARNDMTGQNWSKIPVALIEMGFFSNRAEAKKMSKTSYQNKIASGISNGIEKYMKKYYNVDKAV